MRTFTVFTIDSRYSVPTLTLLATEDEAVAIALAREELGKSEFHTAVVKYERAISASITR